MDNLVQIQHEVLQSIGRTCENLRKAGAEKITLGRVQSTIGILDRKWSQVEDRHATLRTDHWNELKKTEYCIKDFMSVAEETYLTQRGKLVDYERSLSVKPDEGKKPVEGLTAGSRRTVLPKIRLPEFSGKYEDWPAFRDHFVSTIDSDEGLPTVEKLHYLRSCVQGEAAALIQNLPATEASYKRAWRELTDFYQNTRLLVRSYLCKFLSLQRMKNESALDLKRIFHNTVNTYDALDNLGRPVSQSEDLFVHIIVDLLGPRTRDLWDEHISDSSEPPTFEKLKIFLQRRLQTLDGRLSAKEAKTETTSGKSTAASKAKSHAAQKREDTKRSSKAERCSLCRKDHFLMFCETFKSKPAPERKGHVSENNLCINCLGKHKSNECASKKSCTVCGERHHTQLHDAFREVRPEKVEATTSHISQNRLTKQVTVLLATARVRVADRFGTLHSARALVDQGSETSFVSEALVQKLKLPRKQAAVTVIGVGGSRTGVAKGRVTMRVMSHFDESDFSITALVLPRLTAYAGGSSVTAREWTHLQSLTLADPEFLASDPIDILLGADVFAAILTAGVQKGGPQEPVAQKTTLGWILSGSVAAHSERHSSHTVAYQCVTTEALNKLVRRFWEQEEIPLKASMLTEEEQRCEKMFATTHSRNPEGRYVVRLPLATELTDLSPTRHAAMRSLVQMERRFARDENLHKLYVDFMRQYAELEHMSPAGPPESKQKSAVCYLPHHGVLRESSLTTKLRVVFNGSWTLSTGESLNKHFLTGPNLLPPLIDVLMRWRAHQFVLASDIEKMYRQILVHPEDRDLQRILWRFSTETEPAEYRLNTVTYGLACAPFLAIRTLKQLAIDEAHRYPAGAAALQRDVYVDDILTGADTLQEALELQRQLNLLCKAGGFLLRKWATNHAELLANIPVEDRVPLASREWQSSECHTMLGLKWHPSSDRFSFSVKDSERKTITKRSVLSQTAQLFDPLGWLTPVIIRAKILIQTAWLKGLDWDAPLAEEDCETWRLLREELKALESIRIPRWLEGSRNMQTLELHGFADASERAYAAVAYLRSEQENGKVIISLVAAKSKVAPTKQVTLPRLELCAAALLAQLVAYIKRILSLQDVDTHAWLDSTVALSWVQGHPSRWKTYVANRVAEVQRLLPEVHWHHVRGADNPADCASRGLSPRDLVQHKLWWQGPSWLVEAKELWPSTVTPAPFMKDLPEQRPTTAGMAHQEEGESELLLRYSSLTKLLRVTAWCRRWLRNRRLQPATNSASTASKIAAPITASELEDAQRTWIRNVQATTYKTELKAIRKKEPLPKKSTLASLNPFTDDQGLMRVGGRLKHSLLAYEEKHPAILPAQSHLTKLIIEFCHRKVLHGGVQQTLGLLRRQFWVPQGRSVVKRQIHQCVTCVRWRAAPQRQMMANLPRQRVTPARPFQHTGVDYAGPIMLRTAPGRGHKAYKAFMVVFICLSTKAVHLDAASDYSAEAFLAAFRRFTSRRGLCQALYSNRGTNFVGADSQLRSMFSAGSKEEREISRQLASDQVQWHFNPPAAPHFGGIWEAAVKSMKHHIRRVVGETTLTYEEMATLLAQVEACLNSRPLQALTDDPDDITALTPGHFLVGSALNAVPQKSLLEATTSTLTRWRHLQRMRDHFWDRWSREYVQGLAPRPKWKKGEVNVKPGLLCLVVNETTPPTKWPLARILKIHPGDDGLVRVVTVKTVTSELVRPVTKIVLLPAATADSE